MRGKRALYGTEIVADAISKRGRSESLIKQRNEAMVARYYYWAHVKKLKYEECIGNLSLEFYLHERTIIDILIDNSIDISGLVSEKATVQQLKIRFSWFMW